MLGNNKMFFGGPRGNKLFTPRGGRREGLTTQIAEARIHYKVEMSDIRIFLTLIDTILRKLSVYIGRFDILAKGATSLFLILARLKSYHSRIEFPSLHPECPNRLLKGHLMIPTLTQSVPMDAQIALFFEDNPILSKKWAP